jgi:hypothetical protein
MNRAIAILARRKSAVGIEIGDDVPIGKEYEVDLDTIGMAPSLNVETNETSFVQIIQTLDGNGFLPVELLDFPELPEGYEIPPPSDPSEWPELLPPGSERPKANPFEAMGLPPEAVAGLTQLAGMHDMFHGLMDTSTQAAQQLLQWIGRHNDHFRPVKVKLISATSIKGLEDKINQFLASGVEIAVISERIHRLGNELAREIRYYAEPPRWPLPPVMQAIGAPISPGDEKRVDEGNEVNDAETE